MSAQWGVTAVAHLACEACLRQAPTAITYAKVTGSVGGKHERDGHSATVARLISVYPSVTVPPTLGSTHGVGAVLTSGQHVVFMVEANGVGDTVRASDRFLTDLGLTWTTLDVAGRTFTHADL